LIQVKGQNFAHDRQFDVPLIELCLWCGWQVTNLLVTGGVRVRPL
jgi:hypothetical protein